MIVSMAAINPRLPPEARGVAGGGGMRATDKSEAERVGRPGPRTRRCQVLRLLCMGRAVEKRRLPSPRGGSDVGRVVGLLAAQMFEVGLQSLPGWAGVRPNCGI